MSRRRILHPVPGERLPRGFAQRLENPPEPVEPRPAATVVLLRSGPGPAAGGDPVGHPEAAGLQVLLLRRSRATGFVPGAWVFPGGRIDAGDHALARRLGRPDEAPHLAALREAFEETGILLTREGGTPRILVADRDRELDGERRSLLEGELTMEDILGRRGLEPDPAAVTRIAHWITPEVEPRRYDTHFFAAAVPPGTRAAVDDGEIVEHRWLAPAPALAEHEAGHLPMVLPTVRTLVHLGHFRSPGDVLEYHEEREVVPILPRFVRTPDGVALEVEEPLPGDEQEPGA